MPKPRTPITHSYEGKRFVCRFRHPLHPKKKVCWVALGLDRGSADQNLADLNKVFMHPEHWRNLPEKTPEFVKTAWLNPLGGVTVSSKGVSVDGERVSDNAANAGIIAGLESLVKILEGQLAQERAKSHKLNKMLERLMGRKVRQGACPTLQEALESWIEKYSKLNRDPQHKKIVEWDLKRFVAEFKPSTLVDDIEGQEKAIDHWLGTLQTKPIEARDGKPAIPAKHISAGRRAQIRRHVLKFLHDSGAMLDRQAVTTVKKKEISHDRGAIRKLTMPEAKRVLAKLKGDWRDMFRVQLSIGLRPSELVTLKRADFSDKFNTLVLSPLEHLTLKTGSREISLKNLPALKKIIKRRLKAGDIVFPNGGGKPWASIEYFFREYNTALDDAAKAAGIDTKMDGRIGRRTLATHLLNKKWTAEQVGKLLGDDPKTILLHYGDVASPDVESDL